MNNKNPEIRVRYNYRLRQYREGKITDHKLIQANQDIGDLLDELEAAEKKINFQKGALQCMVEENEALGRELTAAEVKLKDIEHKIESFMTGVDLTDFTTDSLINTIQVILKK